MSLAERIQATQKLSRWHLLWRVPVCLVLLAFTVARLEWAIARCAVRFAQIERWRRRTH